MEKKDYLDEYLEQGFSLIPLHKDTKRAAISWKKNQTQRASPDEVKKWMEKDFNLAVVTGKVSKVVGIDVDRPEIIPELKKKLPEIDGTTVVKSPRGKHFYFSVDELLRSNDNFLDTGAELKAERRYLVLPESVINGRAYGFEVPLSEILPLPSWLVEALKIHKQPGEDVVFSYRNKEGRACVPQILAADIEKGNRDLSLFVLYNLLVKGRNTKEFSKRIVRMKNALLREPLCERELRDVFKKSYEKISCHGIKSRASYVTCTGCEYAARRWKKMKNLILSNMDRLPELTPQEAKVLVLLETHFEGKIPSISKLSELSGAKRDTVKVAVVGLEEKGCLKE